MELIDELVGYAKANVDAARTKDDQQTWAAHHRNCVAVQADIKRLRARVSELEQALSQAGDSIELQEAEQRGFERGCRHEQSRPTDEQLARYHGDVDGDGTL